MNKKINLKNIKNGHRQAIVIAIILALSLALLTRLTEYTRSTQTISYSQFLKHIEAGDVHSVHVAGQEAYGTFAQGGRFEACIPENHHLWDLLKSHNIEFSVAAATQAFTMWYLFAFLCGIGLL